MDSQTTGIGTSKDSEPVPLFVRPDESLHRSHQEAGLNAAAPRGHPISGEFFATQGQEFHGRRIDPIAGDPGIIAGPDSRCHDLVPSIRRDLSQASQPGDTARHGKGIIPSRSPIPARSASNEPKPGTERESPLPIPGFVAFAQGRNSVTSRSQSGECRLTLTWSGPAAWAG
jgi:hypothetical protein